MTMHPAEVCHLAQCLARNRGWACFPCGPDKKPVWPKAKGGSGYKDASADPDCIAWLWQHWGGPLVGVATGKTSGIDLLDFDIKHAPAGQFWRANHHRIPETETYRSRGGGLHLYLQSHDQVTNTTGKLANGVDTRGLGGYLIYWAATGSECLDHSPPAPWPAWLLAELLPKPEPLRPIVACPHNADAAIEGLLRSVERAREGNRNSALYWGACRMAERILAGEIAAAQAEAWLLIAARQTGLGEIEAKATIKSGLGRLT
jgi:hypothetical protein